MNDRSAAPAELPPACSNPCNDCPWVRTSLPGWLGPFDPERWVAIAHSEEPIACHQTIATSGSWDGARQCAGAAIFRANRFKLPKNPTDAARDAERDTTLVFDTDEAFVAHHRTGESAEKFADMRAEADGRDRYLLHCLEHDTWHPVADMGDPECPDCLDQESEDPTCTEFYEVRPCQSSYGICPSEEHDELTGEHHIEVKR